MKRFLRVNVQQLNQLGDETGQGLYGSFVTEEAGGWPYSSRVQDGQPWTDEDNNGPEVDQRVVKALVELIRAMEAQEVDQCAEEEYRRQQEG